MRSVKRHLQVVAIGSALCMPLAALSHDNIVEQIELGLELYLDEEYGAAISELEFAINDIRRLVSERISTTFPDAPDGWSGDEVTSAGGAGAAAMLGGSILQRTYRQNAGNGQLEATMMVDSPMAQGLAVMFNNPAMIAAQPNTERVRVGRESAIVKWESARSQAEVTVLLDSRILLQVKGQRLDSAEIAVELMRSWDFAAVREQTAR